MRDKLNESKAAQIGLVAVLVVVAAVFFLGKGGGGSGGSEPEPEEAEVAVEGGEALSVIGAPSTGMGELPTSVPGAKAPPHAFRLAYDSGAPVALLIVHDGGIDDHWTKLALKSVARIEGTSAFVVPAKKIADYASVTVGLNVNQVPALIVLRPKRLSHGTPQASVSYGYQTPQSVYQQIRDAAYVGPEKGTYHPD
ncbi:MAG TPA: hypothetical protein VHZ54_06585 [Solirubrobacterales bacterium]|jgi:hypothetical protein|nr:hypothetical protein [Solirubrobacterales bacterium]